MKNQLRRRTKNLISVWSAIVLSLVVSLAIPGCAKAASTLVAYWAFDESSGTMVNDSSGNNQTGTNYGATISTDTPPTTFANSHSLYFNGSSAYVQTPSQSVLAGSHSRSISLWFKTSVTSQNQGLFDSGAAANHAAMQLYTIAANGAGGSPATNPGGIAMVFYGLDIYSPLGIANVANNTWHYMTFTYDQGTNSSTLYFDGVAVQSYLWNGSTWSTLQSQPFVLPGTPNTTQNPIFIGKTRTSYFGIGSPYFNGNIDDVRIYDGALTSAEVSTLASGNFSSVSTSGSSTNTSTASTTTSASTSSGSATSATGSTVTAPDTGYGVAAHTLIEPLIFTVISISLCVLGAATAAWRKRLRAS